MQNSLYVPWTQIIFPRRHRTPYENLELLAGSRIIPPVIILIFYQEFKNKLHVPGMNPLCTLSSYGRFICKEELEIGKC